MKLARRTAIRYGSLWQADHPFVNAEQRLSRRMSTASRPLEVCRDVDEGVMMKDVLAGRLDIASTSDIQSHVPETSLMYLPYLYRNLAHFERVWRFNANPVARRIERLIRQRTLLEPLGYSIVGARECILTDRPIVELADLAGMLFRVDDAAVSARIFAALGAAPKIVDFYDVKAALKKRAVQAAENATINMIALGWDRHCRFVSRTGHRFLINYELASHAFWSRLSAGAKANLRRAFKEYLADFATVSRRARSASLRTLRTSTHIGLNTLSVQQRRAFKRATQRVIEDFTNAHRLHRQVDWIRNA
jgi:TRAP-type C4-dicarboxylate transport system substrate-binding protein